LTFGIERCRLRCHHRRLNLHSPPSLHRRQCPHKTPQPMSALLVAPHRRVSLCRRAPDGMALPIMLTFAALLVRPGRTAGNLAGIFLDHPRDSFPSVISGRKSGGQSQSRSTILNADTKVNLNCGNL
jgi:hypothetical protein